jgi:hypothetical protein
MRRAVVALSTIAFAANAEAFESQCRWQPEYLGAYEQSICCMPRGAGCPSYNSDGAECRPGWEFARGAQVGEHSMITAAAIQTAGFFLTFGTSDGILEYYTAGGFAPGSLPSPRVMSVAPAGPGGMLMSIARIDRNVPPSMPSQPLLGRALSLPDFAQSVDGSHSLSDFLLGNEHCLPPNAIPIDKLSDAQALAACHTFSSHMGAVNSTHFAPQNRAMYELYHGLAIDIADKCRRMKEALLAHHLYTAVVEPRVRACETEALAFQSTASHYLEDAWSTGHMWQRWGTPSFVPLDRADQRLASQMVAITSGIIHGWRSVVRGYVAANLQHDRMCMPGPFPGGSPFDSERFTRWTQPGFGTHLGGGDVYLRPCEAAAEGFSFGDTQMFGGVVPLKKQNDRMMTCLAKGFAEVYDLGPKTMGERIPNNAPNAILSSETDIGVRSSTGAECWSQRVTNRTMLEGARGSDLDLSETNITARLAFRFVPTVTGISVGDAEAAILGLVNTSFNHELSKLVAEIRLRAKKNPNGSDAAELDDDVQLLDADGRPRARSTRLARFLGFPANRAAVDAIKNDEIPYIEKHDRSEWSAKSVGISCNVRGERDCAARPGTYCDPTAIANGAVTAQCVRHEAAILNAFRAAETAAWCTEDGKDELTILRENCVTQGLSDPRSDPCRACAQAMVTHVAAGCDETSWRDHRGGASSAVAFQVDAVCDVLSEAGLTKPGIVPEHAFNTWNGGNETGFSDAMEICTRRGSLPQPYSLRSSYDYETAPPAQAVTIDFATLQSTPLVDADHAICTAGGGTKWWRFFDPNGSDQSHVYGIEVRPRDMRMSDGSTRAGDLTGLAVAITRGPDCAEDLRPNCGPGGLGNPIVCRGWERTTDFCVRLGRGFGFDLGWSKYDLTLRACSSAGTVITATSSDFCCPDAPLAFDRQANVEYCCPLARHVIGCARDSDCCSNSCVSSRCR